MPSPLKQDLSDDSDVTPAELWKLAVEDTRVAAAEAVGMEEVSYEGEQVAYSIPKTSWREQYFSSHDRANYLAYIKMFKPWVKPWTSHGDKTAVVPRSSLVMMPEKKWDELVEVIEGVKNDYPLVSDDIHSTLEMELQNEAWEEYERKTFQAHLKEHLEPYYEDTVDRHGNSIWEMVDNLLDDSGFVDEVFYEISQVGNGGEWEEGSDGHQSLSSYFYRDMAKPKNMEFVKRLIDDKIFPQDKRQLKFPFADEVVEMLLSGGLVSVGECSVASRALAGALLESHSYSCVMINLPKETAESIISWGVHQIPAQSIYVDEDIKGREDEIHVTVKYGLSDTMPSEELKRVFIETAPFDVQLLPITLFRNGKYDVVKLDVTSAGLREFNRRVVETTPCPGDKHPEYHPHVTLAYVKPGTCDRLEGMSPWDSDVKMGVSEIGKEGVFRAENVVFSSSIDVKQTFSLGPEREPEEVEESEEEGLVDPRELANKACLFGRERTLRWIRLHVGRRIVTRVEISHVHTWREGRLRVCFDRGEAAQADFCSYEVLKSAVRQWRNLYGAELFVGGQPAGVVSYRNPALADTDTPRR